jgi:hypothetical protein
MRVRIVFAFAVMTALVVFLWLAANTRAVPIIRTAITVVPPPPVPKPPAYTWNQRPLAGLRYLGQTAQKDSWLDSTYPCQDNPPKSTQGKKRSDSARASFVSPQHRSLPTVDSAPTPERDIASLNFVRRFYDVGTTDGFLSATIIKGQQAIEAKKLESESQEKRLKMIVQAALTLLLSVVGLYVVLNKKATPTQRATAAAAMGIALGYWFK